MEKKMSIYKKLFELQKAVKGLSKDGKSYSFQYVTGNKLLSFIKPLMDKEGLLLKQEIISIDNVRQDYQTAKGSKSEILSKVLMKFTWIDVETGETDSNMFGANGQNGWDKGVGSALTYAERYFLMKFFHIATDEDDIDNPAVRPNEIAAPSKKKQKLTTEGYSYLIGDKATKEQIKQGLDNREMNDAQRGILTEIYNGFKDTNNTNNDGVIELINGCKTKQELLLVMETNKTLITKNISLLGEYGKKMKTYE